jgi:hypothetical protein
LILRLLGAREKEHYPKYDKLVGNAYSLFELLPRISGQGGHHHCLGNKKV